MNVGVVGFGCVAVTLAILSSPVSAQEEAEGWVELKFLEPEISLEPGEKVVVPLKVRAELQCDPLQDPPSRGVEIVGRSGTSHYSGDRAYYVTMVEPSEVPFEHEDSDLYVVNTTVEMTAQAELAVDKPMNQTVSYATPMMGVNHGCTFSGWSLPAADAATVVLRLVPPEDPAAAVANESPGMPGLATATAMVGLYATIAARRIDSKERHSG